MSFEEPKAPIVRIRKKKIKKKSKENDIVHLPVRASRQTRYSSLTTPANPQTKGRECCRSFFASCFKIPVCRTICFRCILPKCYEGEGSDDDDALPRDEGYHSQNRRSSEVVPVPGGGAEGGSSESHDVEMTELKTETVTLIPPPRVMVNEYRKDPCSDISKDLLSDKAKITTGDDVEMNYIEVETVPLSEELGRDTANIPETESKEIVDTLTSKKRLYDTDTNLKELVETGYEEPVQAGVLEQPLHVNLEKNSSVECGKRVNATNVKSNTATDNSEYFDFDKDYLSDDESKYYVNEDVLKRPATRLNKEKSPTSECMKVDVKKDKLLDYANLGERVDEKELELHSADVVKVDHDKVDKKPHDYVNLRSLESKNGKAGESEIVIKGMVNTKTNDMDSLTRKSNSGISIKVEAEDHGKEPVSDSMPSDVKHDLNSEGEDDKEHVVSGNDNEKLLNTETKKKREISSSDSDSDPVTHEHDISTDQTKLI